VGLDAEGWIKEALDRLSNHVPLSLIEEPPAFQGQLRPYQLKGLSWLAFLRQFGFGACLADDMGLGKCITGNSFMLVNGTLEKAESVWEKYAGESIFDGEGYWADPTKPLLINAIDKGSGQIVQASINHLYRQQVITRLRTIKLEDGSSITITSLHKLLTNK